MPAVTSPAKTLVTGANGFVATWLVKTLLEKGYSVRGTFRSAQKAEYSKKLFESYDERFEVYIVEDIGKEGAFDEAVKGVDLIAHVSSPFTVKINKPDDLLIPSIRGTLGILESAQKHGSPNLKRIILTSSCASIFGNDPNPKVYDETMWNDAAVREIKEQGAKASPLTAYRASKAMAERAAWDFYEKVKPTIGWDLVALCPPVIFGPPMQEVTDVGSLNLSMLEFFGTVVKGSKDAKTMANAGNGWVDVRDLAQAFVLAGEKPEAGGERIIVSGGPYYWQEIVDVANSIEPAPISNIAKGEFGSTQGKPYLIDYNTTKAERVLAWNHRSLKDCVRDSLVYFKEKGFAA